MCQIKKLVRCTHASVDTVLNIFGEKSYIACKCSGIVI